MDWNGLDWIGLECEEKENEGKREKERKREREKKRKTVLCLTS